MAAATDRAGSKNNAHTAQHLFSIFDGDGIRLPGVLFLPMDTTIGSHAD
ncbi:MAG TPA: hypothetical protein VFE46_06740 [Pirellulales bacterium]|nr:hypothetical protein [Pirellulales bacterium]